jgi:hypothetical protein
MARFLRLALVVLLLALSAAMPVAGHQPATPVTSEETRLYVSHGGRFTAQIPATWTPDYSLVNDRSGPGGYVGSSSITWYDPSISTLEDACEFVATDPQLVSNPAMEVTTWRNMPACLVRGDAGSAGSPVSLVFAHPEPATGLSEEFVAVTTSAEHFDAITESISFDPATVTAEAYLDSAIDSIESQSIMRDRVDWATVRREAHEQLGEDAEGGGFWQAHRALDLVMAWLKVAGGDAHNYVIGPGAASELFASGPNVGPSSGLSLDGVGYVAIPGFGGDQQQAEQFTDEMLAIIDEEAKDASCGWIIDLRWNTGGNMYPMIYGLAPLLQPGTVMSFRNVIGNEFKLVFEEDGSFTYAGMPQPEGAVPSDPEMSRQPVAVLVSQTTVSAGEATALALASRDFTRFFGEPTGAMATAPVFVPLIDGAMVAVAAAWMTGPNGAIYPNGISPDVSVSSSSTLLLMEKDPAVVAAMDWLTRHPACADDQATPMAAA